MREPNKDHRLAFEQSRESALDGLLCFLHMLRLTPFIKKGCKMLDIGCGPGHFVKLADALGISSDGFDICINNTELVGEDSCLFYADFANEVYFLSDVEYDLVLCLEVAEHVEPEFAHNIVDACTKRLKKNGLLVFSAASPGQGGAGHVNEMPNAYWLNELENTGRVVNDEVLTNSLRYTWSNVVPRSWWYGQNVMAFKGV